VIAKLTRIAPDFSMLDMLCNCVVSYALDRLDTATESKSHEKRQDEDKDNDKEEGLNHV
jgi:hypothetical protein